MRKFDMDEPPVLEESLENVDNVESEVKKESTAEELKLEEKYYRYESGFVSVFSRYRFVVPCFMLSHFYFSAREVL